MTRYTTKKDKVEQKRRKLVKELSNVYTPSEPIIDPNLFSGRQELLERLRDQLPIKGKNFVFYGERGVGKTSFYNILFREYQIQKHNCSKSDNFVTIFLNILSNLGEQFTKADRKFLADAGYSIGSDNVLSVRAGSGMEEKDKPVAEQRLDLNFVLTKLTKKQNQIDAIVLDEFQNIEKPEIQTEIIEVVKGLADNNIDIKIVIVGIAGSDTELLTSSEYPQYKLRHFIAERIPKMNFEELRDIIDKRKKLFNIKFELEVKDCIAQISSGYPSYVHMLAFRLCSNWLRDRILDVTTKLALPIIGIPMGIPRIGGVIDRFFTPKTPSIVRIGFNITTNNLVEVLQQFIAEFKANYPDAMSQYMTAIKSSDRDIVQQILLLLAKSQSEEIRGAEISKILDVDEKEITRVAYNRLNILIKKSNEDTYALTFPQIRPFIQSLEYLQHENIQPYSDLEKAEELLKEFKVVDIKDEDEVIRS